MEGLLFLFGLFLALGLFFLTASVLKLPTMGGLIGVLRGDDSTVYFQMLAHDFKQIELQRLKAQAQKIPPKIRVFSFVMLVCFLLTYLAIICYVALESLGGMF